MSLQGGSCSRKQNCCQNAYSSLVRFPETDRQLSNFCRGRVMHFRIRYKITPGHTHMRVFVGSSPEVTHGKAGDLCMTNEEFEEFKTLTPTVEFIDETEEKL